jgi:acyl-coenzyme A synthetase/AMP-(fatty) acid ligase
VVQTHRSFANTTECYAKGVIGYAENDVTLSVPKLYFGYATGANLFFPFSVGGASALFPEPPTAEVLFERIRKFRPTVLVNVPTMIHKMASHPDAKPGLSSIRVCIGRRRFRSGCMNAGGRPGVENRTGGTAEMWHI